MPCERDIVSGFTWRFGLRSLFYWVLIVGVALGWWLDHRRSVEKINVLNDRIHYWSSTAQIIEAGLKYDGFTIKRKLVERRGQRGIEFYFTSPDGNTFEGGAMVVNSDIEEVPEDHSILVISDKGRDPQSNAGTETFSSQADGQ